MKIYYTCEYCGDHIDILETEEIDEAQLGFDCLTEEERQDIIKIDKTTGTMYVYALCDNCIQLLGLANKQPGVSPGIYVH